jgi:hypothetical protein
LNEGQHLLNDGQQHHRPTFAEAFPKDGQIDALVEAFARGDYARVRREGAQLAVQSPDEAIRQAARTLVERTGPDALTRTLLALAALLLLLLSAWWIVHGKAPH